MAGTRFSDLPIANNTDTITRIGIQNSTDSLISGAADLAQTLRDLGYTPAPINSPTFTGDPKAPTPPTGDNDTSIATTAFVKNQSYIVAPTGTGFVETVGGVINPAATTFVDGAIQVSSWNLTGLVRPISSNFTPFNGGSGSLVAIDKSNRLQLSLTNNSVTGLAGLLQNSIIPPYTIDVAFSSITTNNAGGLSGIALSDGTKYIVFYAGVSGGQSKWLVDTYTTSNGPVTTAASSVLNVSGGTFWMRITNNGTNRVYSMSSNGQDYITLYTNLSNVIFSTETKFAMVMFCTSTIGVMKASYYHYLVSNSVLGDGS